MNYSRPISFLGKSILATLLLLVAGVFYQANAMEQKKNLSEKKGKQIVAVADQDPLNIFDLPDELIIRIGFFVFSGESGSAAEDHNVFSIIALSTTCKQFKEIFCDYRVRASIIPCSIFDRFSDGTMGDYEMKELTKSFIEFEKNNNRTDEDIKKMKHGLILSEWLAYKVAAALNFPHVTKALASTPEDKQEALKDAVALYSPDTARELTLAGDFQFSIRDFYQSVMRSFETDSVPLLLLLLKQLQYQSLLTIVESLRGISIVIRCPQICTFITKCLPKKAINLNYGKNGLNLLLYKCISKHSLDSLSNINQNNAAMKNRQDLCLDILLNAGASVLLKDDLGKTPLLYALEAEQYDILAKLTPIAAREKAALNKEQQEREEKTSQEERFKQKIHDSITKKDLAAFKEVMNQGGKELLKKNIYRTDTIIDLAIDNKAYDILKCALHLLKQKMGAMKLVNFLNNSTCVFGCNDEIVRIIVKTFTDNEW